MKEITVHDLKKKKENGDDFILLDVRENFEYEISNLGGKLLPMGNSRTVWQSLIRTKIQRLF